VKDSFRLLRSRSGAVWAALVLATVASSGLGESHLGSHVARQSATVAILAVAFVKAWYVTDEFMELRHAPRVLRLVVTGWVVLAFLVLSVLYLVR
jgi:hypothetical protein